MFTIIPCHIFFLFKDAEKKAKQDIYNQTDFNR